MNTYLCTRWDLMRHFGVFLFIFLLPGIQKVLLVFYWVEDSGWDGRIWILAWPGVASFLVIRSWWDAELDLMLTRNVTFLRMWHFFKMVNSGEWMKCTDCIHAYLHKFFRLLSSVCKKRYGLINVNTLNISSKLFKALLQGKMSSTVLEPWWWLKIVSKSL